MDVVVATCLGDFAQLCANAFQPPMPLTEVRRRSASGVVAAASLGHASATSDGIGLRHARFFTAVVTRSSDLLKRCA
eukprot:114759-Pleurochrysis_carterae.AAC.1